jgi:ATP-dependent Clp protease adapter protein ClpS
MNLPETEHEVLTIEKEQDTGIDTSAGAKVILFNDDHHTFDDVITQVIKAIHCDHKRAENVAWTVHNEGKCEVYTGAVEECLHVSAVLEEIHLKTEIEFL